MTITINKDHPCSKDLYNQRTTRKIEYIVIHYTGDANVKGLNYAICNEKHNANRDASWHYVVGNSKEKYMIYQSVPDMSIAWHCGDAGVGKYKKQCTNTNSIGIEHCFTVKNGKSVFEEGTIEASVQLVASLMKKYNIPISHVIRHYDVTGKKCPQPFLYNDGQWEAYLKRVTNCLAGTSTNIKTPVNTTAGNLKDQKPKTIKIELFGKVKEISAFNINGNNFCKLRDLETKGLLDIRYENKTIYINNKPYLSKQALTYNGFTYIKLQELKDFSINVSYDSVRKIPVIKKK